MGLKLGQFLKDAAPAIPIVGGIVSNILEGMNTRSARLYDSPKNQVARLHEAGLPTIAGSSIQAKGGFQSKVDSLGTENFVSNLGGSLKRDLDRKQLKLLDEQIRAARAAADVAGGERDWKFTLSKDQNGTPMTNQNRLLSADATIREIQSISDQNKSWSEAIDYGIKRAMDSEGWLKTQAIANVIGKLRSNVEASKRIDNLIKQGKLYDLQGRQMQNMTDFQDQFAQDMKNGRIPDFSTLMYLYGIGNMRIPDIGGTALDAARL